MATVAAKQIGGHCIAAVLKALKQRTGSNSKFNDIICMAAYAGNKAVFFFISHGGSPSSQSIYPIDTKIGMDNPYYYIY